MENQLNFLSSKNSIKRKNIMKRVLLLLTLLLIINFSENAFSQETVSAETGLVKSTLNLRQLAISFSPKQLNLNSALLENTELNNFLSSTDKAAIKADPDFDFFITMIVLKQYEFHLTKFHQPFDLFSMKAGNAGFIVQSIVELCALPPETRGMKSSEIITHIESNEKLKSDPAISEIVNKINTIKK